MGVALRGLNLRVAEELADHRQRHSARNEQRRECVAQIMDTDGGQIGLRLDIFPEPLDVLKRLAFGIARKHPLAILGHAQLDRAQKHGGGSADRGAMQAALLRGGSRFDPDGGVQIELIPERVQDFAAQRQKFHISPVFRFLEPLRYFKERRSIRNIRAQN